MLWAPESSVTSPSRGFNAVKVLIPAAAERHPLDGLAFSIPAAIGK
jgi:hypothetical protein